MAVAGKLQANTGLSPSKQRPGPSTALAGNAAGSTASMGSHGSVARCGLIPARAVTVRACERGRC